MYTIVLWEEEGHKPCCCNNILHPVSVSRQFKNNKSFFFISEQVNFYHDHTKLILCTQQDEYLLTYINEERTSTTFQLSTLLSTGCNADLRNRLEYALNMLLQRSN